MWRGPSPSRAVPESFGGVGGGKAKKRVPVIQHPPFLKVKISKRPSARKAAPKCRGRGDGETDGSGGTPQVIGGGEVSQPRGTTPFTASNPLMWRPGHATLRSPQPLAQGWNGPGCGIWGELYCWCASCAVPRRGGVRSCKWVERHTPPCPMNIKVARCW